MKKFERARIISNEPMAADWYAMRVESPEIASGAAPGGFVELRAWQGPVPLLARPISIAGTPDSRTILLWIRRVGEGTRLITELRAGEEIDVVGPLGRGFRAPAAGEKVFFVAGSVGAAPLRFVLERSGGGDGTFFFGSASARETPAVMNDDVLSKIRIVITTDDGTAGRKGFVTDAVRDALKREKPDMMQCCGPRGMLKAAAALAAEAGVYCEVSLESYMSCGIGACMGCAVPLADSPDGTYAHACVDGPVFDSKLIDWSVF